MERVRAFLGVLASLTFIASTFVSGGAVAADAIDAYTVGQPAVFPQEFNGDLSKVTPVYRQKEGSIPTRRPVLRPPVYDLSYLYTPPLTAPIEAPSPRAPMPSPIQNFAGLGHSAAQDKGFVFWPPDTNGDVGPNHYIQTVNQAVGIYSKTGTQLALFSENTLWNGVGGTPCNGDSAGDPVALYDWIADRFVITWFAFAPSLTGPFYQCIAASKTSDPVAGGWWLYAVRMDPGTAGTPPVGDLNDYGKFGLWHDCLYMAANEFANFATAFDGVAFASFSRANLYAGQPLTYALGYMNKTFNVASMLPSNNLGSGINAVQPGTPNYYVSQSETSFAFEVRKFTAGPNCGGGGTLSAATNVSQTSYPASGAHFGEVVPQPNTANKLDNIDLRLMQKAQYRKIGGAESVWVTHSVDTASGQTATQWAQINVTGGTIATTPVQQQIYSPDAALYRFMSSLAVDKMGNMALGFSTSGTSAPNFPSIKYAGRLATDPLGTLPQTEVSLVDGLGSQINCGGSPCGRWGDYSGMAIDPADDCTFWYTNQYYTSQANGNVGEWSTRIGSFKFPNCTSVPKSTRHKIDFDGNGKHDIAWRNSVTGQVSLWLMNGLTASSNAIVLSDPSYSVTHTGDLSGDGKTDLIWRHTSGATVAWLMNGLSFTSFATLVTDPNWVVQRLADFNGDGTADILWHNAATGQTAIWLMNGLTPIGSAILLTDPNWSVTQVADFNGDGKVDLLWHNSATGATAIWLMNGTSAIGSATLLVDPNWTVTNVGDFNGDGKFDLLWRNSSTGQTAIWLMNGVGAIGSAVIFTSLQWQVTHVGDFDGNGKDDLVWRNASTGQTAVWLQNGLATTSSAVVLTDTNWQVTHVADTNGDGKSDLIWRNTSTGMTTLWLMNGTTFSSFAVILSDPNWSVSPANGL